MRKILLIILLVLAFALPASAHHEWGRSHDCDCYYQPYQYKPYYGYGYQYPSYQPYYGYSYPPANRFSIGRPQTFRLQKPDGTLIEMSR